MPMTLHINLSEEMQSYIKSKVRTGFYGNATEVIRDAIRRMQASDPQIAALPGGRAERSGATGLTHGTGSHPGAEGHQG